MVKGMRVVTAALGKGTVLSIHTPKNSRQYATVQLDNATTCGFTVLDFNVCSLTPIAQGTLEAFTPAAKLAQTDRAAAVALIVTIVSNL